MNYVGYYCGFPYYQVRSGVAKLGHTVGMYPSN